MKFYIVTPAYNALKWLPGCVRSVADQVCDGIEVHHHIQDGGSEDGTQAWLANWQQSHADSKGYTFSYESAPDNGMYQAINKAWERIPEDADITAHLNSDEQYLPEALEGIAKEFKLHPEAEVAISTYVVVDVDGRYICHRRPITPHKWSSRTVCEIITCSCFHRVNYFRKHNVRFDAHWKSIADVVFYKDLVNINPSFLVLPQLITSVFTVTGGNLQWAAISQREWNELMSAEPWWINMRHALAYRWCNMKRMVRNMFCSSPESYSIYIKGEKVRRLVSVKHPTCHWGNRTRGK